MKLLCQVFEYHHHYFNHFNYTCKSPHVWEKYGSLEDRPLDGEGNDCHKILRHCRTPDHRHGGDYDVDDSDYDDDGDDFVKINKYFGSTLNVAIAIHKLHQTYYDLVFVQGRQVCLCILLLFKIA